MIELTEQLRNLVLGVWISLHPGALHNRDAAEIADACVAAILDDAPFAPATSSHDEDLVLLAIYAMRESWLKQDPIPISWDAIHAVSCGVWQEPCAFVHSNSLADQARYWLFLLHRGKVLCPEQPAAPLAGGCHGARELADSRQALARTVLAGIAAWAW